MQLVGLPIHRIRQETDDTKTFFLEAPTGFTYVPGQFLTVVRQPGQTEVRRQYSFSTHPRLDEHPAITVKRIDNGEYSRWLFDEAKPGDVVSAAGVSGLFTLPADTTGLKKIIFIAAGSGITPIHSLIKEVLHFHPHLQALLIYSNRSAASTVFLDELKQLQSKFPSRLTIEWLFSNAQNLLRARLNRLLLEEFYRQYVNEPLRTWFYVCGPEDYREMVTITLLTEGVPADHIRREIFHSPPQENPPQPPDKKERTVKIILKSETHTFKVKYPVTILQAAQRLNIAIPYSCEAGRCGACAATCLKGEVWMKRNEVLLDSETERGRVLTCTGYPIKGDVELLF